MITPQPLPEYWIVFTHSKHWSQRVFKKHFGHCYIITRDKYNWIVLNPCRLMLNPFIPPYSAEANYPFNETGNDDTVIYITFKPERYTQRQFKYLGLMNCVSYAKYCLGLPIGGITPYGLCKKLLTLTAKEYERHGIDTIQFIKG